MTKLSYSSLNILHTCPHNWLNKTMGIPQPDRVWFAEGRKAHRLIQDHIGGIKKHEDLEHIELRVPIVEEKDFDERCKFAFKVNGGYLIRGYYDGLDLKNKRFVEIKTSVSPWSVAKFQKAWQRKLYALSNKGFEESILITGSRKPKDWKKDKLKIYRVPITAKDRDDAVKWIDEGIKILESGDFLGDLNNGVCTDPRCWWGDNCTFKL